MANYSCKKLSPTSLSLATTRLQQMDNNHANSSTVTQR